MCEKDRCREAYLALCRASVEKSIAAMDSLLDDGFVFTHMNGLRQDKWAFIRAMIDGTMNCFSCLDDECAVTIRGNAAELTGNSRVCAAGHGNRMREWQVSQTMRLIRSKGKWRIAMAEARTK